MKKQNPNLEFIVSACKMILDNSNYYDIILTLSTIPVDELSVYPFFRVLLTRRSGNKATVSKARDILIGWVKDNPDNVLTISVGY